MSGADRRPGPAAPEQAGPAAGQARRRSRQARQHQTQPAQQQARLHRRRSKHRHSQQQGLARGPAPTNLSQEEQLRNLRSPIAKLTPHTEYEVWWEEGQLRSEQHALVPPPVFAFPNQLGPFAMSRTTLALALDMDAGTYQVKFSDHLFPLQALTDWNETLGFRTGTLAPAHPITLSEEQCIAIDIPPRSRWFAWAYPLWGVADLHETTKQELASQFKHDHLGLVLFGGFVYLDEDRKFIGANAVTGLDRGMMFSKPHKWDNEFTKALHRADRFQPITAGPLLEQGARYFCWLNPAENLEANDKWVRIPGNVHGAFVYLFSDAIGSGDSRDCVFLLEEIGSSQAPPFRFVSRGPGDMSDEEGDLPSCAVCMDAAVSVLLLPCGHLTMCEACAKMMKQCPNCRAPLRKKDRVVVRLS